MNKSLADWLVYINTTHQREIDLSLERVKSVAVRLASNLDCPTMIVGGTNGKGSTCSILEAIYSESQYKVGLFSSPHIFRFNERIKVHRQAVDDEDILVSFEKIDRLREGISLTYYEFSFLAALDIFHRERVDIAIFEVGLGGRFDAVNILDPVCSVVTNVAMDHMDFLGDTREKIGWEKAGIYRPGSTHAILGDEDPPQSVLNYCRDIQCDLRLISRDFGYVDEGQSWKFWSIEGQRLSLAKPLMRGAHQLLNASVSIEAVTRLQKLLPLDMAAIRDGLLEARNPGRIQVLPTSPAIILDVAHNVAAAKALIDYFKESPFKGKTYVIFGAMADKQVFEMIRVLDVVADYWLFSGLSSKRSINPREIMTKVNGLIAPEKMSLFSNVSAAIDYAIETAALDDRIVVCGSFVTVAEAGRHSKVADAFRLPKSR